MVSSTMPERGRWPSLNIPEKPNRVSLAVDTLVLGTIALGTLADGINTKLPHSLDKMTPLIETHIGNLPPTVAGAYLLMNVSRILLYKVLEQESAKKMEPLISVATIMAIVGANIVTESLKNPNPEFVGDVVSGIVGGLMVVVHMNLPDRYETAIARKFENRHKTE